MKSDQVWDIKNNTIHLKLPLLKEDRRGQFASFTSRESARTEGVSASCGAIRAQLGCCAHSKKS
jgi:hypothetical protein